MSPWIYDIIVQEWIKEGRSSLDIHSLTEKQCKIYFTDGCIRRFSLNANPFKKEFKYGNGGLGCEITSGIEEITEFFKKK